MPALMASRRSRRCLRRTPRCRSRHRSSRCRRLRISTRPSSTARSTSGPRSSTPKPHSRRCLAGDRQRAARPCGGARRARRPACPRWYRANSSTAPGRRSPGTPISGRRSRPSRRPAVELLGGGSTPERTSCRRSRRPFLRRRRSARAHDHSHRIGGGGGESACRPAGARRVGQCRGGRAPAPSPGLCRDQLARGQRARSRGRSSRRAALASYSARNRRRARRPSRPAPQCRRRRKAPRPGGAAPARALAGFVGDASGPRILGAFWQGLATPFEAIADALEDKRAAKSRLLGNRAARPWPTLSSNSRPRVLRLSPFCASPLPRSWRRPDRSRPRSTTPRSTRRWLAARPTSPRSRRSST